MKHQTCTRFFVIHLFIILVLTFAGQAQSVHFASKYDMQLGSNDNQSVHIATMERRLEGNNIWFTLRAEGGFPSWYNSIRRRHASPDGSYNLLVLLVDGVQRINGPADFNNAYPNTRSTTSLDVQLNESSGGETVSSLPIHERIQEGYIQALALVLALIIPEMDALTLSLRQQ